MENKRKKYSDDDKKKIGSRIKKIRLEKGMTLEEFGKLFDTSKSNVSMWEKGRSLPNPERMKQIAKVGDISVSDLIENNGRKVTVYELPKLKEVINDIINNSIDRDIAKLEIFEILHKAFPNEKIDKAACEYLVSTLMDIKGVCLPDQAIIQIYRINSGDAQPKIRDRQTLIEYYKRYIEAIHMFKHIHKDHELLDFIETQGSIANHILYKLDNLNDDLF
ncbi:helix-turn-helix domain-containing protein [Peptostreptococcus sp.]